MKIAIPDLVSNSYLPAIAAAELGFLKQEGIDATHELIYPVSKCYEALRDGQGRLRRRLGAFGALGLSRMARRQDRSPRSRRAPTGSW